MRSRAWARRNWRLVFGTVVVGILAASMGGISATGKQPQVDSPDTSTAERLVASARQAEIAGDTGKCYQLLREAVRVAPDFQLARWQLGQMQIDGQWVAVEEAQRRAAANPKQAQYSELRAEHGETPAGQLALARWCRKNDLQEESRFHWASVLAVDANNEEALRALDMRWSDGQLLTRNQIAQKKVQLRESKRLEKQWAPTIAKWRKAVASDDSNERGVALDEIRSLKSVDAIFFLEQVTLPSNVETKKAVDECRQISPAFVEALTKMEHQAATESLARHAVFSSMTDVLVSAVAALKNRPPHDYVPMLLNGLAMPVETSFSVRTAGDGSVHYSHSLYREGANADLAIDANYATRQFVLPGRDLQYRVKLKRLEDRSLSPAVRDAIISSVAQTNGARYANIATATEVQVWNANQSATFLNSRIMPVLANTTGQDFTTAKQWWDWWQDFNEYYAYDHPVERQYYSGTNNYFYGKPVDTVSVNMSCFLKGTPVWTKTGRRPIESLELGDLVLAQNVSTGELSYKPVVGRTVRPPSEILNLKFRDEEINTTLGHPFWVTGVGWRMAKELEGGAILHGVTGSTRVEGVQTSGKDEAFNLVVADFDTYFVGESGILVHDNKPRTPTRATVPGLAVK